MSTERGYEILEDLFDCGEEECSSLFHVCSEYVVNHFEGIGIALVVVGLVYGGKKVLDKYFKKN